MRILGPSCPNLHGLVLLPIFVAEEKIAIQASPNALILPKEMSR